MASSPDSKTKSSPVPKPAALPIGPNMAPGSSLAAGALSFASPLEHTAFSAALQDEVRRAEENRKRKKAQKEAAKKAREEEALAAAEKELALRESAAETTDTAAAQNDNASLFSFSSFKSTSKLLGRFSRESNK